MVGCIDLADPEVESAATVVARIERALPYVKAENVILAPDCGMKYLPRERATASCARWSKARRSCASATRGPLSAAMLFAFHLLDRAGAAALRAQLRPAHKAYLAQVADRIAFAGPLARRRRRDDGRQPAGDRLRGPRRGRGLAARRALHARRRLRNGSSCTRSATSGRSAPALSRAEAACATSSSQRACRASSSAPARCAGCPTSSTALGLVARPCPLDAGPGARSASALPRCSAIARVGVFAGAAMHVPVGVGARRVRGSAPARRRLHGRDRRRLDDRPRQGDRARDRRCPSSRCRRPTPAAR